MSEDQSSSGLPRRVIPFDHRRSALRAKPPVPPLSSECPTRTSHEDEDVELREDFRRRMKTNVATLVVVALLIWGGLWLADAIASLRKIQDCVFSGRRNCAPITISEHER